MKNLTSLLAVLFISFVTMAGDWPYKRLDRLYDSDQWKCLKVSKKYIKHQPEKAAPYYFASAVYKEKSKTHLAIKTRYTMMMKSIGYAMKFEEINDLDLMSKVNWGAFIQDLRNDTDDLILQLDESELSNLGDRLAIKHDKMVEKRNEIVLIAGGTDETEILDPVDPETTTETTQNTASDNLLYFGLASGNEVVASYNQIQEQELLRLINEERKALFMQPLKLDENLVRAARYHAYDMATQDYFLHDSYDRIDGNLVKVADAFARIEQFQPGNNSLFAENIAGGNESAEDTFKQWSRNEQQNDVLFNESGKKVGIGICYAPSSSYGYYWVLITEEKR